MKIMMLVSHPIQYYVPIYKEIAKDKLVELLVVFRTRVGVEKYIDDGFGIELKWDVPLLEGYNYKFLSNKLTNSGFEFSIFKEILNFKPEVLVIHGYDAPANIVAIFFARLCGIKVIVRSDTKLHSKNKNINSLKGLVKKIVFSVINGFLSIGSLNKEFYLHNKVPEAKIFHAPFCIDNSFFEKKLSEDEMLNKRKEYGICRDDVVLLSLSKLIPSKRILDIINAAKPLMEFNNKVVLLIVGSGECEKELKIASNKYIEKNIKFIGFKNQTDLPSLYNISDVFIFAAEADSWGLALNEAMAAELPSIVASGVGAAVDLIRDKNTGFYYESGDVDALKKLLSILINNKELRTEMGRNAKELIGQWSIEECAKGIKHAALKTLIKEK